jgi:phosphatidylserine synthase
MQEPPRNFILRNAANVVSILGVLPLCILFSERGYAYLVPLIVYNNVMDDLDGVLAVKLDIKSEFGAILDNVCDAISHTVFVLVVGLHYFQETANAYLASVIVGAGLLAAAAIILRVATRLDPKAATGTGSPTNELIRHLLFVILVSQTFQFDPSLILVAAFSMHAVTMLVPFRMPYLIRSLTKSAVAIGVVNVALLVAWLIPGAALVIAAAFFATYLLSFLKGGSEWLRTADSEPNHR